MSSPYVSSTQVASSVPFDNTQVSFNSTDAQSALGELRQHPVWDQDAAATTLNGTLTLTTLSKGFQLITGSATGFTMVLPSALTLFIGQEFMLVNQSSQPMTIKDGAGNLLFTLSQTSIGFVLLQAQGNAAGTWVYWQTFIGVSTGIVNYNVVSSTTFSTSSLTDVVITSFTFTPGAGTYAVWFNASAQVSSGTTTITQTVYGGGTSIPDSVRSQLISTANAPNPVYTQSIVQVNGSQAIDIRVSVNKGSLTIGGRSLLLIRLGT